MSQVLPVEIHDELYAAIELQALRLGTTPATLAAATLAARFDRNRKNVVCSPSQSGMGQNAEVDSLEEMFGSVDLGAPTGLDNDQIDADLAREYGNEGAN